MTPAERAEFARLLVRVEELESAVFGLIQDRDRPLEKRAIQGVIVPRHTRDSKPGADHGTDL